MKDTTLVSQCVFVCDRARCKWRRYKSRHFFCSLSQLRTWLLLPCRIQNWSLTFPSGSIPCLVASLLYLVPGPICHFPISSLQTAGSSSIITFLELSLNVRGNSISLCHGEGGERRTIEHTEIGFKGHRCSSMQGHRVFSLLALLRLRYYPTHRLFSRGRYL